jgi:PAS domain-containing protein
MSPLDLLAAFEGTNRSERRLRAVVDIIPAQLWFGCPDGTAEFLNQRRVACTPGDIAVANARGMHEYANKRATGYVGTPLDAGAGLGWIDTIHREDQELVREA